VTAQTRRRLVMCFLAVALTVPAESILLKALTSSSQQDMARTWAQSLSDDQRGAAAGVVESYPFTYRRELMRVMPPAARAATWRRHIAKYIALHPNLNEATIALLSEANSLATESEFTTPTAEGRAGIARIAEQTRLLLGTDDTLDLFYRLGPKDGTFASAAPLSDKLASYLRTHLIAQAFEEDCDCSTSFGCDSGGGTYCRGGISCNRDENWPMCGWWWNEICDGLCWAGMGG
jgi:hypothetical protein